MEISVSDMTHNGSGNARLVNLGAGLFHRVGQFRDRDTYICHHCPCSGVGCQNSVIRRMPHFPKRAAVFGLCGPFEIMCVMLGND